VSTTKIRKADRVRAIRSNDRTRCADWTASEAGSEALRRVSGPPVPGEGEGGCLFDEMSNLGEPTERLLMDVQTGLNSHGWRGVARTARLTENTRCRSWPNLKRW
jgi:hypothetical protein